MSEIYKIGFILTSLMLATVAALTVGVIGLDSKSTLIDYIAAFGSVVGGLAGLTAAMAALIGIDAWKKQLTYGKYFASIWEAKVSLRKMQLAFIPCSFSHNSCARELAAGGSPDTVGLIAAQDDLISRQAEFFEICGALDKVVERGGTRWQGKASRLRVLTWCYIHRPEPLMMEFHPDPHAYVEAVSAHYQELNMFTESIEKDLDSLEDRFH